MAASSAVAPGARWVSVPRWSASSWPAGVAPVRTVVVVPVGTAVVVPVRARARWTGTAAATRLAVRRMEAV
ncbi:hypothetical protein MF406_13380 [Georgenia sp. TF02-10]|nr:hypothetical protein MF406_13380 [Georgenia sp. TF02-10]